MRGKWFCWLALVTPLVWLFGRVLLERRVLNFRDVAHYYRPLWQWTTARWGAGEIPLWNSLDGLGMPVHADPTASLFYPGQLLFALPLDFTTRLNLYVVLHLILAAALLYYASRRLGASALGATAGALSYSLGGQVLFQYCNPIYLVSAAWLPLALLSTHHLLQERSLRWGIVLAMTLALMTLGGDPQMAYHVLLVGTLYVWLLWRDAVLRGSVAASRTVADQDAREANSRSTMPRRSQGKSVLQWWRQSRLALLGLAAVLAFFLAAMQILPTAQWSTRSARAAFTQPRNVVEVVQYLYQVQANQRPPSEHSRLVDITAGLLGPPRTETHHEHVYEFSVAPWRWLEFVWPNIGGTMFPIHRRWMTALPAEGRIWTPTLYLGLLPLLAGLTAFSLRRRAEVTTRWLSWLTLFGLLGSLGAYGLGWLLHELSGGAAATKVVGAPVGGLYWFMVVLLPGYVQFRYPAKLMVFATVGISLLAARHWDAFAGGTQRWAKSLLLTVAGASAVAIVLTALLRGPLLSWLEQAPPEFPFGKLDGPGALLTVQGALLHALVLALAGYALLVAQRTRPVAPLLLLLLTMADLLVANGWIISSSPPAALVTANASGAGVLPQGEVATRFLRRSAPDMEAFINALPPAQTRLDELLQWERQSLAERWYLADNTNAADAQTSIAPLDLQAALAVANQHFAMDTLAIDGVKYAPTVFAGVENPNARRMKTDAWSRQPRAYLPKRVEILDSLTVATPSLVAERSRDVLATARMGWMDSSLATIESSELARQRPHRVTEFETTNATCRITRYEHEFVEVAVDAPGESLLVLADYYSPDWTAEVVDQATGASRSTPIYRTNRVLRGVMVPAGQHLVIFRYRPTLFYLGLAISSATLLVLATAYVCFVRQQHRFGQATPQSNE